MKNLWKSLRIGLLAAIAAGCSGAGSTDRTWDMLAPGLPPAVLPRWAILNMGQYALKQTHKTLFRAEADGEYRSELLAGWSRSLDSRGFRLCPKPGLVFEPGAPFDSPALAVFLDGTLARLGITGRAVAEGACVAVSSLPADNRFLELFSKLENAPSRASGDPSHELGLGPYRTISVSSETIVLGRKETAPGGYDQVVLHAYRGPDDARLADRTVEDFNRIPADALPSWVKEDYAKHGTTLLKSFILLIDHPDLRVRRLVRGCLPAEEIRSALLPDSGPFHDIENILPLGIPGARKELPRQRCAPDPDAASGVRLVFVNWKHSAESALARSLGAFSAKTGMAVELRSTSESAFVKDYFSSRRDHHLAVVSVDAIAPDYASFFGPLFGDPIFLTRVRSPAAKAVYDSLLRENDAARKVSLAGELNRLIAENGMLIPLYQEVREQFYPRNLKGLSSGQDFLEYPDVAALSP